jgi:hypothetical protein
MVSEADVNPQRRFAIKNCRSVKGSLDHVGGGGHKQGLRRGEE